MSTIVDQFNDPAYGTLYRQTQVMPGLGEFVKESSISIDAREAEALPKTAFAWPQERRFPIHTADHAALSYAYAKTAGSLPLPVKEALENAIDLYEIDRSIYEIPREKEASEKTDSSDFLLPDHRLFPARNAGELKIAQERLLGQLSRLDLESRATACGNLVKKAQEHGVGLHPEVLKLAGMVTSTTRSLRDWLEARASVADNPLYKTAYRKLSDGLREAPPESKDRAGLLKLASTIGKLDREAGLERYYDRKLPDPLRTVFNTEKRASTAVDLDGTLVPLEALEALPPDFWASLVGDEMAQELEADPSALQAIVETLPLDLKIVLKSQLGA